MTNLKVRPTAPDAGGRVIDITPASAGWKYVGFQVRKLAAGRNASFTFEDRESCLVILTGRADVTAGEARFAGVGGRASVFDDAAPGAVYVPAGLPITLIAVTDAEIAVCTAPGAGVGAPRAIGAEHMSREVRGSGANQRFIRNILPETEPAERLLVVEALTPGGHWSSYPPHKHDTDTPHIETQLEETYYHRLKPAQGFAFQRVYTDDRSLDETISVEDGDVVLVPRGYHPVGTPHGYDLYYLNVMAGPRRQWIFHNDPAHEWMLKPPAE
jgi:5-deoxy-glucuronate isomerase